MRQGFDRGVLQRSPHARGELAGDAEHRRNGLRCAHGEADSGAGHAVALAQRMQLYRPFCAGERQQAERRARIEDARVGIVVDDEDAAGLGPRDNGGEAVGVRRLAGRHVGIVEPQEANGMALGFRGGGEGLECGRIRVVAVGLAQGVRRGWPPARRVAGV